MIKEIADEQLLAMLKHLASGKDLDTVATIARHDRAAVLEAVSKHGYPNSVDKGIQLLAAKIDRSRSHIPEAHRPAGQMEVAVGATPVRPPRPATTSPSSVTSADARPVGPPDEIPILLNTGKNHPAKRIQAQTDRVIDAIGRLRNLIAQDEAKHAKRRAQEAEKAAARAEVARLEKQLAVAKAKLREGSGKATSTTIAVDGSVSSAQLRAWAKSKGIDVPPVGRVPAAVRDQYAAEHPDQHDGAA